MAKISAKMPNLKNKIEEKLALEKELEKVDDEVQELEGDKQAKISKDNQ